MNESEMFGLMMGDMYESDDHETGQTDKKESVEQGEAPERSTECARGPAPAKDELPTLPEERPLVEPVAIQEEEPEKEPLPLEEMTTEEIIAAVRETFPDGPPLLYPTMPNWKKFCDAFPHCVRGDRTVCGFYQPDKPCHCELFEKAFPGVGWWCVGEGGQAPATSQGGRRGAEDETLYYIPMPEEKEPVASAGEAVPMGWGTEPGEVDAVADMARARFTSPPTNRRGFPDFPTFCDGYGKSCGQCRFFHDGRGPFCLVWAAAWPDFQRVIPARCGYPIMPDEKDAKAGRERLQADVADVRARLKRAPLQYPDGPDWFAFCGGYPAGCDDCRYYVRDKACWCRLWEACFPGVVHWYDWPE